MARSLFLVVMMCAMAPFAGCSSNNSYDLVCYNKTAGHLNKVKISHGTKSFNFTSIVQDKRGGFMMASSRFGKLPKSMELSFETENGEQFVRTVDFSKVQGTGHIAIIVGPQLQVSAKNKPD